ncbi:hypothetical protein CC80DRAFT_489252 [Byssothecium circinans]|uniref:UDP-Glycosyltransferase/glycogen phosphorylase n=1 Tax=Byssothecium circinans TaxID=147558 RepID=A0A6A5U4C6_9PLEO|nr:hypothetical protein CC80DRAFT_489252 [Byssothecium circinans]
MADLEERNDAIRLALYPSAHGLGHFMRIVHLAQMLHETGGKRQAKYLLFIRTNVNKGVRESLQAGWSHVGVVTFSSYEFPIQPSVVQKNPYTLSTSQTWDAVRKFDANAAVEQEERFVKDNGIQIIISDCPSIPCVLNVPSLLVTNFTFDTILQGLLATQKIDPAQSEDIADIRAFIQDMTDQYQKADALIRMRGEIHMPYNGRTVDIPAHFRHAESSKTDTLEALNIPELLQPGRKILLHCFGGQPQNDTYTRIPQLPPQWVCLSQTIHAPPHFYAIKKDAHIPDLIAASDAVLGKLGWGMCSEVIGNGYKPFIFVPRSAFLEEEGLVKWMQKDHRRLVRMEVNVFEAMEWEDAILQAEALAGPQDTDVTAEGWKCKEEELVNIVDGEVMRLLGR